MTEGWNDVLPSLATTGFFEEAQLKPEVVPLVLADLVRRYSTVIGYGIDGGLTPIGSGTFVRRADGQHGILTAGHVIGAIKTKENIHVLPMQDRQEVVWPRIEGVGMAGHGEANDVPIGPDIGLIPLSGKEVEILEALGAVFFNRSRQRDPFGGETCQISIVFGFVDAASDLREKMIVAHGMLKGKTEEHAANDEGWDYAKYAITNDDPWIPGTHGGVSGSAVWRIDLPVDGSARKAVVLEGLVFAEGPSNDRMLIAHGSNSIRITLNEK
ncbi:MAG: hypothetical protein F4Z55_00635 [Boseongicola sp. SB0667_bin_21]|nr:hypothetical protein [Boseongicola sp. SB0667_bin_21]